MSQEYFNCNNFRSVLVTTSLIYIYLGNMIMLENDIHVQLKIVALSFQINIDNNSALT